MAKIQGVNLSTWWSRLTKAQLGASPEVNPHVQPVMLVSDASKVGGHWRTRDGIGGFTIIAGAGNFSAYCLHCAGDSGGLYVHWAHVFNPAGAGAAADANRYNWTIGTPFSGIALGTGLNPCDPTMVPRSGAGTRLNATAWIGGGGAGHIGDLAVVIASANEVNSPRLISGWVLPGPIYVPPGRGFIIEGGVVAQGVRGCVYFSELDAPPSLG